MQEGWTALSGEIAGATTEIDASIAAMATADETAGAAMIAENEAVGASFTSMLGPIGAVTAALGIGIVEWGKYEKAANATKIAGGVSVTNLENQAQRAISSGNVSALGGTGGLIAQLQAQLKQPQYEHQTHYKLVNGTITPTGPETLSKSGQQLQDFINQLERQFREAQRTGIGGVAGLPAPGTTSAGTTSAGTTLSLRAQLPGARSRTSAPPRRSAAGERSARPHPSCSLRDKSRSPRCKVP